MSDSDALLAAIRQAPDDDAPRLIYADWLDEHGQPERAEFIRVQIELAQKESPSLRKREAELLEEHHDLFAGAFKSADFRLRFKRGFITSFGHNGVFCWRDESSLTGKQLLRFFPDGTVISRYTHREIDDYFALGCLSPTHRGLIGEYSVCTMQNPAKMRFTVRHIDGDSSHRPLFDRDSTSEGIWIGTSACLKTTYHATHRPFDERFELVLSEGICSFQDSP